MEEIEIERKEVNRRIVKYFFCFVSFLGKVRFCLIVVVTYWNINFWKLIFFSSIVDSSVFLMMWSPDRHVYGYSSNGPPDKGGSLFSLFCFIWFFGLFCFGGGGNQSWPGARSNIWHTRQNFYHSILARKDKETLTIRPSLWTVSKRRILISTPKRKIVLFSSSFCFFSFVFVSMNAREKQ